MTYGKANRFILEALRGDNSSPTIEPVHYEMAILEIATRCTPKKLKAEYTGNESDVFRLLPEEEQDDGTTKQYYLRFPVVPDPLDDSADIDLDSQLFMALVYYAASLLSYKNKEKLEAKGDRIVNIYTTNELP